DDARAVDERQVRRDCRRTRASPARWRSTMSKSFSFLGRVTAVATIVREQLLRVACTLLAGLAACSQAAHADEGGVSFWPAGQLSSFAALPGGPGFSIPAVYFHESADAGGSKSFLRGGNLIAGIEAKADILFFLPTYTFAQPVLGGQAAFGVGAAWAHENVT